MRPPLVLALLALAGCATPSPAGGPGAATVAFDAIHVETALGAFTAILFCGETPATCAFMRGLVEDGYYDGRAFGRVIPGFVIQEVDRTGGTTDQSGTVTAEFGTSVHFSAGAWGIARGADPESGGSEFFVMDFATSHLYGNFTAFAQTVEGLDVVHAIARVPAVRTGPAPVFSPVEAVPFGLHDRVPVDPVEMTRVTMTTVELPADVAARYPLQTAESYQTPSLRATLEWPADLASGRASELSWYFMAREPDPTLRSTRDPEPVDLSGATLEVEGAARETIPFAAHPGAPGATSFSWTPPAPGSYQFRMVKDGEPLAVANLTLAR